MASVCRTAAENHCVSCPGLCCSRNLVNLCGYDIWTIARQLEIEPTSFVSFAQISEQSPYNFRLDDSEAAYCPSLYMKEQPYASRRCVFLMELPNHLVRCGIYSLRPIACRAYPLALVEDAVVVKPWAMCPEMRMALNQTDVAYWHAELARHDMEFSIYVLIVTSWNSVVMKMPTSEQLDFRPFLNFLMNVYRKLELVRVKVPEMEWPGIWHHWRRFTSKGINPLSLEIGRTQGPKYWGQWLLGIREVVTESTQGIESNNKGLEKSPLEMLA